MSCETCAVYKDQVAFLQEQVRRLQATQDKAIDRVVALVNPSALAVARGDELPKVQETPAEFTDAKGVKYKLTPDGLLDTAENVDRAYAMLDASVNGRPYESPEEPAPRGQEE